MTQQQVEGPAGVVAGNGAGVMTLASQATRIEAVRAAAEVAAQVQAAQMVPRNMARSIAGLKQTCAMPAFADQAFYRYPRGRDPETGGRNYVTGITVHLARELARLYGNVQHGMAELARDEDRSEMNAWAWDVENNTRVQTTFFAPHFRDVTIEGKKVRLRLEDLRDIYENNANLAARREREMIKAIVPPWFVQMGEDLCRETLARIGAKDEQTGEFIPVEVRLAKAADQFAEKWGVRMEQLEAKLGSPFGRWVEQDLATLRVLYRSLSHGESTVGDEFPAANVAPSDAQLAAQAAARGPDAAGPGADETPPPGLRESTRVELDRRFAEIGLGGAEHRALRQAATAALAREKLGGPAEPVRRWRDITEPQGQAALEALARFIADTPEADRAEALRVLAEVGRAAASAPADGEQRVTAGTLAGLRDRFTAAGIEGDDMRRLIIGVLLRGSWTEIADEAAMTEAEVRYVCGRFDAVKSAKGDLGDKLRAMGRAAARDRDRAEAGPGDPDSPDGPGGEADSEAVGGADGEAGEPGGEAGG